MSSDMGHYGEWGSLRDRKMICYVLWVMV